MVDKSKSIGKKVSNIPPVKKSGNNSKKESKTEAFLRIAERRVKAVLNSLRLLGNCSNKANYEYSKEQVENMYISISNALTTTLSKFTPSKAEQEQFSF